MKRQKAGGWSRTRSEQPALAHLRATKVPSISLAASSIDDPQPSLRISIPKILAHRQVNLRLGSLKCEISSLSPRRRSLPLLSELSPALSGSDQEPCFICQCRIASIGPVYFTVWAIAARSLACDTSAVEARIAMK